jgi:hypothetical protein
MASSTCHFVPLSTYDWSFNRVGPLPWNPTVYSIIAAFSALAIWSTVELTVRIFFTFKKHTGIYFYSILATTWGVTLHAIGFLLKLFAPHVLWIFSTIVAEIGWVGMVSGFSVVLWSRLHLVWQSPRLLRWVLIMIIVDAFLFHTLTVVAQFGLSSGHAHHKWAMIMAPMERIQVTAFTIQETIISALYMHATYTMLKGRANLNTETWRVMALLFLVQVLVILIDVVIITLDYVEFFTLEAIIHPWVYAVKLTLEFVVLNQLVGLAQGGIAGNGLATISDSSLENGNHTSVTAAPFKPTPMTLTEKKNWFARSSASTSKVPSTETLKTSPTNPIPTLSIYNPHTYQPATATIISTPESAFRVPALSYEPKRENSDTTLRNPSSGSGSASDSSITLNKMDLPAHWPNTSNEGSGNGSASNTDNEISDLESQYLGRL